MAHLPKGQGIIPMPPFMSWLSNNIPAVYDNTMTYYEELCSLIKYLEDIVVPAVNANAEALTVVSTALEQLKQYVDNYFANLDVQEEINNKLDEMAENGTLQEIITTYIQANVAWTFDTVADMKLATNLIAGSYARTLGFYSLNDGGGAIYKISDTGTANEMDIISVGDLFANLCVDNQTVNIKQLGAKGDGITDDTAILTYAFGASSDKYKKIILNEKYLISSTLTIDSSKDIIGVKSNLQGTTYSPEILASSDIKFIDCTNKTNILLENINIKHINTQSSDVIDLTRARYITLTNVKIYQPDTSANCTAIAINDTNSSSDFSGYFVFNNVTASYHKVAVKSRATYITLNNCNFNHCTDYAIWLTEEGIGGINSCNITGEGIAIRYDGNYGLNIQNCYMEGYYLNECIQNTNNVSVDMRGCKIYERTGTGTSKAVLGMTAEDPQVFRNTKNDYIAGYTSNRNLTLNGDLAEEKFWGTRGTTEYISSDDMPSAIGLPNYMKGAYKLGEASGNSAIYQEIGESFSEGETVTIGAWIYTVDGEGVTRPLVIVAPSSDHGYTTTAGTSVVYSRPSKNGVWQYYTCRVKLSDDYTNLAVKVQINGVGNVCYVTGISFKRGVSADLDANYTPNKRKAITDKLIIKGSDNKYYQITCDGSNLGFTEVTHPEYD